MADNSTNKNTTANLMSEFQKLRVETTGLHSVFSEKSTVDISNLKGNNTLKRIEDSCEELKNEIRERLSVGNESSGKKLEGIQKQLEYLGNSLENMQKTQKAQDEMVRTLLRHTFGNDKTSQVLQPTINKKQVVLKHTFENIDDEHASYGSFARHFGYKWL